MSLIDLSQLPAPEVVENLDYESLYDELLADFRGAMGEAWSAALESDPVVKLLELAAYRELLLRARINDAARAVMLGYATQGDLDQLAAGYNVKRLVIQQADATTSPPTPAVLEGDDSLRNRTQLAFDQLSVAGPRNAYVAFALGATGASPTSRRSARSRAKHWSACCPPRATALPRKSCSRRCARL